MTLGIGVVASSCTIVLAMAGCSGPGEAQTKTTSPERERVGPRAGDVVADLPEGSIGFIWVKGETDTGYEVKVSFPAEHRDFVDFREFGENEPWYKRTAPILVQERVSIFDSKGKLGELPAGTEFRIRFWTENDGGPHYRPSANVSLEKSSLRRPLITRKGRGDPVVNYGGFVVHGDLSKESPRHEFRKLGKGEYGTTTLILEGDYDGDGEVDARIVNLDFVDAVYENLETRHSDEDIVDGGP